MLRKLAITASLVCALNSVASENYRKIDDSLQKIQSEIARLNTELKKLENQPKPETQLSKSNYIKYKDWQVELGVGAGIFNYNVDTTYNSLLKWRDSKDFISTFKFTYDINATNKVYLSAEGHRFSGGEFTDDDLNNYDPKVGLSAYNTTEHMRGKGNELEIAWSNLVFSSGNDELWSIIGFSERQYNIQPKGVKQIIHSDAGSPAQGVYGTGVYYNDRETQHTNILYRGFIVGGEYVKNNSNDNKYIAQLKFFLPVQHVAKQKHWGYRGPDYDWKNEQERFGNVIGIDLRLENKFRFQEDAWIGIYTFYKYIDARSMSEKNWNAPTFSNSNVDSKLSIVGVGINISF